MGNILKGIKETIKERCEALSPKQRKRMNYNKNLNIFNNYKYVYAYV